MPYNFFFTIFSEKRMWEALGKKKKKKKQATLILDKQTEVKMIYSKLLISRDVYLETN